MTRAVAVLRSSVLLLLAVGGLLMHTDGTAAAVSGHGRTSTTAMAMAGMAVTGSGAAVGTAAQGRGDATATDLSGPSSPASGDSPSACGGGLVCRAVLTDPHALVAPAGFADLPPIGGAAEPRLTRVRSVPVVWPPLSSPSRERLQVWRC
ncbi:MAG: hypothetical protein NVS3B26_22580 [Mycobacteriales bacterium]